MLKINIYKVTDECISCHACVEVAKDNFEMGEIKAFVKKQPENEQEEKLCQEALQTCPVGAIKVEQKQEVVDREVILAKDNVKKTLDKYPHLKDVLISFSDKFKRLLNPVMYNTLANFATFKDAAKVSGVSLCELLHILNKANSTLDKLLKLSPECIKEQDFDILKLSKDITWKESNDRYIYNENSMPEIIDKVSKLKPQENIVIISVDEPIELVKTAAGLGYYINIEKSRDYRISIFNPEKIKVSNWRDKKDSFDKLDVRFMKKDPFDIIIKKAYSTAEDDGFILIQTFIPYPMINMLKEMGFDFEVKPKSQREVWVYFYKKPTTSTGIKTKNKKDIVVQSATPVAYPVIMKLLQSDVIRDNFNIKELKVWEETEKHLAWIVNKKADISFSAVITSLKLKHSDIKIPALFVWDNFVILTRYKAKDLSDIKGRNIHTPLFEEAPPTKITKFLIKASGLNPADFNFVYGAPFGRPEKIYADFVQGKADTVILREPEASYAIKIMQDRKEHVSIISYNELFNKIIPGFGSFPNAGIVFKGEFVRKNPDLTKIFLDELKKAIEWVNNNKKEAAKLSFDIMRQSPDRIELFLNRVNFNYVSGEKLLEKVKSYFSILKKEDIITDDIDDKFLDMFRL